MQISKLTLITISVLAGCTEQDQTVKGVDDYKAEALAVIVAYDVPNSLEYVGDDSVVFVDVREGDELAEHGKIQGAVHVPRGVLEFYIDPNSSYHMDIFSSWKKLIFYKRCILELRGGQERIYRSRQIR